MISWYACVTCDVCGAPAGGVDDLRESVPAARWRASELGFVRVSDHPATLPVAADLCLACAESSQPEVTA